MTTCIMIELNEINEKVRVSEGTDVSRRWTCFFFFFLFLAPCSAGEGPGHHKVLPHVIEARRMGVGAELRHHRAQQSLVQTSLYSECELRPQVSRPLEILQLKRSKEGSLDVSGCVQSAPECQELQLSEEQNPAVKAGRRFADPQDHPTHFRGKGVRMKSKARAAPYPQVVH